MKRIPVYLNENELKHILFSLNKMPFASDKVDSDKLNDMLEEKLETFSEELDVIDFQWDGKDD